MRKALLLVASLLFLGGCLDYEEVISLAKDGSGVVRVDATVDLAFADKLMKLSVPEGEKPPEDADDPYKMLVSKEEILKNVQGVEGVTVKECLVEEAGGTKKRIKLNFEFKSLDALRRTTGFAYRELAFAEKDGAIEATYKVDARFLRDLGLLSDADGKKGDDPVEKKMHKVIDDATAEAGARFTIHFPSKLTATTGKKAENDDKAASVEVPKKDAKAHAALVKEPVLLKATFAKADNEVLLKKPEPPKADDRKPAPPKKDDD